MAEFDDQHSRVPESLFLGVLWALTGVSFIFVAFRIYAQVASFCRLFLDDFLVVLAWVIMLTAAVIWQVEGKILYDLYAISAGTKQFTLEFLPRYNKFMRFSAPFEILFYSALWCVKFSFMALFYRISAKVKSLRIWWFVVLFCTASVYIASVADIEYKCSLGGIEYIITQCPQPHHVHYENRMFWANCAGDVITDLMILSIPFLVLWKTKVSLLKKLILLSIFSATIFIMIVSVIRVAVGMTYDHQINIDWLCFWSFVEVDVAIIVSCVASLRQLFVTSQNQSSSARAAYHNTTYPILKHSKDESSQVMPLSAGDIESSTNDEVPMSPLSIVHVRKDFEVTRIDAGQEVDAFLMEHVDYDSKVTDDVTPLSSNAESKIPWKDLPYSLRRLYLYREFQVHNHSQCMWSNLVQGILDLPNQRTTEETVALIHQVIDAYLCGNFGVHTQPFDPDWYTAKNKRHSYLRYGIPYPSERIPKTLKYALATSTILRGDYIQLQALLNKGLNIAGMSDRLALIPLDIAAKKGSKGIMELLITWGCPDRYHYVWNNDRSRYYIKVINTMAASGNDSGLEAWIDYLLRQGEMGPWVLKRAMTTAAGLGQVSVMVFVQEKYEALYGSPGWNGVVLGEAIRRGSLDAIKFLFRLDGVDANTRITPTDRRPLLKTVHERICNRAEIVEFLIENGADPNGDDPKKRTPVEVAIKLQDFECASVLLKLGATVNFKRIMPLLLDSTTETSTSAALLQLLWPDGGSYRAYKSGRKSYKLCRDARIMKNIENTFLHLGWSEQDVKEAKIDHFIDVY
ncbi:hypothetical protein N7491_006542 [Penicillium cf. griseofulvum]|uniref:Rhodopsin domain-containing protein n=1 Tax=Penicillium cf. griseofulvum TaxID=2972120 RepID=A0A9W9M1X3_9EURO|nr:hypothetical protein N7472_010429 [Penicillium cf. griseofulvum]KAJ5429526.1 hypothetical protein N7491_006542 [Penicillium cf. griseofulvum]